MHGNCDNGATAPFPVDALHVNTQFFNMNLIVCAMKSAHNDAICHFVVRKRRIT